MRVRRHWFHLQIANWVYWNLLRDDSEKSEESWSSRGQNSKLSIDCEYKPAQTLRIWLLWYHEKYNHQRMESIKGFAMMLFEIIFKMILWRSLAFICKFLKFHYKIKISNIEKLHKIIYFSSDFISLFFILYEHRYWYFLMNCCFYFNVYWVIFVKSFAFVSLVLYFYRVAIA